LHCSALPFWCSGFASGREAAMLDLMLGAILALFLIVYLSVAFLRPEKF
jgi:K+-transporting ATPase KdpF subunit